MTSPEKPQSYTLRCHCRAHSIPITTTALLPGKSVNTCNCSWCSERQLLNAPMPISDLDNSSGEIEKLKTYQFHRKVGVWKICDTCGSTLLGIMGDGQTVVVNARCVEGLDLETFKLKKYDGKSF